MAHEKKAAEVDEDGLLVQKYHSVVLVVMPPGGFGEQTLRYARSSLYNVRVGTWSVSQVADEMIKGRLQDEFLVDGPLAAADMSAYSGILLVASEEPRSSLAADPKVQELVRQAMRDEKLVAAWGNAVEVLARAAVVRRRRVTGPPALAGAVRAAGGRFQGREVVVDGNLVTARDESTGMRFGQALAEIVRI